MRSLFVGRFQPFHNGHLAFIKEICNASSYVIIAIGSAEESHTLSNPFTAGERTTMIYNTLHAEGLKNFFVVPIEDTKSNGVWVSKVETLCPKFDTVFSNNPLVKRLFAEKGYKVSGTPLKTRNKLSGTRIRELMLKEGNWQEFVPDEVLKLIKDFNGVERIIEISGSDKE